MDLSTTAGILAVLQSQGYLLMFIAMLFEGPIITAVAAFAASLGWFNIYIVLLLSLLGNVIGDFISYFIGRIGRKVVVDRYFEKFKISKSMIERMEKHLKKHPGKALAIIKVVPPLPCPGLILAGAVNLEIEKFFFFSVIISFLYSLFFTLIGFYTGLAFSSAVARYSDYIQYYVVALIAVAILIWWLYNKYSKKLYSKV